MIPRKSRGEWYKNKSAWGREKSAVSVFGLLKNRAAGYGGAWRVSKGRTRAPAWRLERTLKALAEAISHRVARKKKKKKNACSFFRLIKTLDVRRDLNYRFISISIIYSEICFATRPIERKRNGEDLLRSGRLS